MTAMEHKTPSPLVERLAADKDVLKDLMREALQAVPEGEMAGFLGARRASARYCARAAGPAIMAATRPPASASWSWRLPGDRSGGASRAKYRCSADDQDRHGPGRGGPGCGGPGCGGPGKRAQRCRQTATAGFTGAGCATLNRSAHDHDPPDCHSSRAGLAASRVVGA